MFYVRSQMYFLQKTSIPPLLHRRVIPWPNATWHHPVFESVQTRLAATFPESLT